MSTAPNTPMPNRQCAKKLHNEWVTTAAGGWRCRGCQRDAEANSARRRNGKSARLRTRGAIPKTKRVPVLLPYPGYDDEDDIGLTRDDLLSFRKGVPTVEFRAPRGWNG